MNEMVISEPTTGEIVRALRCIADNAECKDCRYKYPVGNVILCDHEQMNENAADRLESQEQAIEELKSEAIVNALENAERIANLTARAEQAERERDAAINEAIRAVFYDMSDGKPALLLGEGICRYCQSDKGERIKCKSCFENGNFELRNNLRGQPQDGEGV